MNQDRDDLQRNNSELQLIVNQLRNAQFYEEPKNDNRDIRDSHLQYELQSKDAIIKRLNIEISDLKASLNSPDL